MKKLFLPFVNPVNLIRAYFYHKKSKPFVRAANDLELKLYSKILRNDMLHYGYFDKTDIQPEDISLHDIENAQMRYAEVIVEQITDKNQPIIDVGCGMGGLSKYLTKNDFPVQALTPDINQKNHINKLLPQLNVHHCKFEDYAGDTKFGTIINSESLQYIQLDTAFAKADKMIQNNGRWIITDYFRLVDNTRSKSGHKLVDFINKIDEHGWRIDYQYDMTSNILPTLQYIYMYVDKFLRPLGGYAEEKLKYKKAWLYYLTGNLREALAIKARREIAAIDPELFLKEKKYLLFVLKRKMNI